MKRLLILIFVLGELYVNGQTKPNYFTPVATAYEWNWGRFKYGLRPPTDTLPTADSGSIAYKNGVWYGKNLYWSALGGTGGGSDSSLFATRTWTANNFQPIGTYLTPSDLAPYYTKTQINGFFSGVSSISGYNKSNWDNVYSSWAAVQSLSPAGWATLSALIDSAAQLRAAISAGSSGGDMTKAIYDANNNGIVDVLELSGVIIGNGTSAVTAISGTANQLLRRNAANTAYEFFTPSYLTANQTISFAPTGDITGSTTGTTSLTPNLTIGNGAVTNAKVATGIDAAKLADGSVSNTEFQYINNLTSNAQTQINGKEASFTETTQEFTGSTSMSITLSNTPKSGKAEMYYLNGVVIQSSNVSRTGTGVTLSGFTRWTSDVITAKYSY